MGLRQQIIQDRTDALAAHLGINADLAFLRLTHSLITGKSVHVFDPGDLVDGGQDKQIDVISIEEDGQGGADIYVLQTKSSGSFSSNALIQLHNGLRWLIEKQRKDLNTLTNNALRDKILEYRSIQSNLGPSNLRVHVRFVTNGSTKTLSDEFHQELSSIRNAYSTDTFQTFEVEPIGADELIELSKIQERQTRSVNADIKIRYDANTPSLIKYFSQDLKGIVCSVPAGEIGRLVNDNPDGAVFDLNIRRFLGTRGSVNKDIASTATATQSSYEFWFLNNGVTIVCDEFDAVTDPDNPHVKLRNLQIVNGCQTATTLALAQKNGTLAADVRVLTRIYQTNDPNLVSKIVLTTNNQNQISSRDLRANEPVQLDMEDGFKIYGYFYERKPRQFDESKVDAARIFANELVGQWYLAVVLKNPSDARARKYKVWGDLHSRIFAGGQVEPYIIATLLGSKASDWIRETTYFSASDDITRLAAKRGSFHVARIAAYRWRGNDDWNISRETLKKQIQVLEKDSINFPELFEKAFEILIDIIRGTQEYVMEVDRAFKSTSLDKDIDRRLHS